MTLMSSLFAALVISTLAVAQEEESCSSVSVVTKLGAVRGKTEKTAKTNATYFAFKGIPYAQPPVGERRFLPPLPASAWSGTLNATEFGNQCVQYGATGAEGDEDCLFLNVYAPQMAIGKKEDLRAVMFWIHGGGLSTGTGAIYNPEELMMSQDLVVVTINYRLNILGLYGLENNLAPGNLALRDQIQALAWVKENIEAFGGDPSRVTIFGQSAGSTSAHMLHLSPLASGLISGAIVESGNALNMLKTRRLRESGLKVAEFFGCSGTDEETLACLRQQDAGELVVKTTFGNPDAAEIQDYIVWAIVVDDYSSTPTLPLDPLTAMKIGAFNQVPLMLGTCLNDGGVVNSFFPHTGNQVDWRTAASFLVISDSLVGTYVTDEEVLIEQILAKFHTGGLDFELNQDWLEFMTDGFYLSNDQIAARLTAEHIDGVYNYQLTHAPPATFASFYGVPDSFAPVHGDDLYFLLDVAITPEPGRDETEEDRMLKDKMMKYWGNFAKFGNPTPEASEDLPTWLPYGNEKNYIDLKPEPEMKSDIEQMRMYIWNSLVWNPRLDNLKKKLEAKNNSQ